MAITMEMIKELRERTGAGVVDCKKFLTETGGDMEKAVLELQKSGIAKAAKRAAKIAAEGLIGNYMHAGGRIGVLVEINCETDFVARGGEFAQLCEDVAMQIAAMSPLYVSGEDIPAEEMNRQNDILTAQTKEQGKPENMIPKIVEGKLSKWKKEVCLLDQVFVKNEDMVVNDLVSAMSAKTGEKIVIRRFSRFEVGEGLAKVEHNLAAEIAAELNKTQ